jgi:hypothetical protein
MKIVRFTGGACLAAMLCTAASVYGQASRQEVEGQVKEPDFGLIIERITANADEEYDLESLAEVLLALYHRPVDLNTANHTDLQAIPFLSELEINAILEFREEFGAFISDYELYLIEGLDSVTTDMALPFLQVSYMRNIRDTIPFIKNVIRTSRKSLIIRYGRLLQDQKGYINRKSLPSPDQDQYYAGSADYIYGRFEMHEPNDFDLGLTFEKDAGEAFFFNPSLKNYGFDHYAGYFRLLDRGLLSDLTIGDFQVHFGEGLVWGRGFGNKGSETIGGIRNRYNGPRSYQGASESGFLRGISLALGNRFFNGTAFTSRKQQDAVIVTDSQDLANPAQKNYYVGRLLSTGYHRTPDEIYSKNKLTEYTFGANVQCLVAAHNLTLGATFSCNSWDYTIKNRVRYYNQFNFSGNINYSGSAYYNYYKGKFNIFGEVAQSMGQGRAFVQGIIANILSNVETAVHIRYYDRGYYSKYGRSFAEYSGNNNERGIYWSVKVMPLPHLEIRGYYDMFRSDWLRYNIAAPSTGHELFMNVRFQPKSSLYFVFSFKQESKDRNDTHNNMPVHMVMNGTKRNGQLTFSIHPVKNLKLQSRIQGSTYRFLNARTAGYCLAQDVAYGAGKFKINSRIAYFLVEDYNNQQYMYEHDVLYAYNLPAYNGHGLRAYVLLKYSPLPYLDVWLRASQYHYFDRREIGTGLAMIEGNKKTEIKCQVRIKF